MGGFANSISNNIDVVFANNWDFSGAANPNDTNGLQTDGQLLIGSTALNAGNTHINVGKITSPFGTIAVGYSSPNITLDLVNAQPALETLSDDVNTVITPLSNNIQLVGHVVEQGSTKFSTVKAGVHLLNINPMSPARWIVDPLGFNGTHTTIASALTSATSGDTILIMDGTYTENLTLKAGVNLVGMSLTNVTIVGKCTLTGTSGTSIVSCFGITFQTNSDFSLVLAGTAHATINLFNCYVATTNNTSISYTNSNVNSAFQITGCLGNISTTGVALFSASGAAGNLVIINSDFQNTGGSSTANTFGGVLFFIQYSLIENPITTSSTSSFNSFNNAYGFPTSNFTSLTCGGSGSNFSVQDSFFSGTASAISISTTPGKRRAAVVGCRPAIGGKPCVWGAGCRASRAEQLQQR